MTFRHHISKATACAMVNGPELIVSLTRAADATTTSRRLEHLLQAEKDCLDMLNDIQAAVSVEIQERPTATPMIKLIQLIAEQKEDNP
jgi:hypothetical protein